MQVLRVVHIPCRSLNRLNSRLFINTENYRVLWRIQIQAHNVSSFSLKIGVMADTPGTLSIRSEGNGVKRFWGGPTRIRQEQEHQVPAPCASVEQAA